MRQRNTQPDLKAGLMQSWRVVQIIWVAELVVAGAAWLLLLLVVPAPRVAEGAETIAAIFYAAGLANLGAGWWLRERAFASARNARARPLQETLGRVVGISLVAVTLAGTPAVLGVVLYIASGNRTGLNLLCVLSLIGLVLLRPRLDRWQEIMGAAGHAHRPA